MLVITEHFTFISTTALLCDAGGWQRIGRRGDREDGYWRPEASSAYTLAPCCAAIVVPVPHVELGNLFLVAGWDERAAHCVSRFCRQLLSHWLRWNRLQASR
jgi:hypothetical protein